MSATTKKLALVLGTLALGAGLVTALVRLYDASYEDAATSDEASEVEKSRPSSPVATAPAS